MWGLLAAVGLLPERSVAQRLAMVKGAEAQPLIVYVRRLTEALDYIGQPLPADARESLDRMLARPNEEHLVRGVQRVLDPLCLLGVRITERAIHVRRGAAAPRLARRGWRSFLVKVHNPTGVTAPLFVKSGEAAPLGGSPSTQQERLWLDVSMFSKRPLPAALTGTKLEYRVVQLYSRDAGERTAGLSFGVRQASGIVRGETRIAFDCAASSVVKLAVLDQDGAPVMASFTIRDRVGRAYPSLAKRLAPDFAFQPQIYRAHGETLELAPGTYTFEVGRGPEYRVQRRTVEIGAEPTELTFRLERWVHPAALGWWSGDHHIHAAGCKHYDAPTRGVGPKDILRHCRGEALNVGGVLTWGSCFDYQRQFFSGKDHELSKPPHLLRYDLEVAGFGSDNAGHLCLLGLRDMVYPGSDGCVGWPTLALSTLRWAKRQGAVCGTAHSGSGLKVRSLELPNHDIPRFDRIGAMEYIVDVTHVVPGPAGDPVPAVDFMGICDTPPRSELNIWYHTLNCGYRTRVSGESDFPCIYGTRVGAGRSYVGLDGALDSAAWLDGIARGRCYVSDGSSHLMDFAVGGVAVGKQGSELRLDAPGKVPVVAKVATLLPVEPDEEIAARSRLKKPYWHPERARIGKTRNVDVEVVVNGRRVASKTVVADGELRDVEFEIPLERSSWVALRIFPSAHTNPVFVVVGGKPIRASRRSAQWCLDCVDQCWSEKGKFIAPAERKAALAAYEHARAAYRRIREECPGQ